MGRVIPLLVWLCALCDLSVSISLDQLFPYGLQSGDEPLLAGREDASSKEVHLTVPLKYYQREYLSLFVNENGLISFLTEISTFYNVQFPMDYPVIAPFYADIDTRGVGQVYWRASTQEEDRDRAANLVGKYYSTAEFQPREVVVVSWDQVGYFDMKTDKTNIFQIIIASDGLETYTVFLYPQSGIEWVRGTGKNRNKQDAQAQAGFMSGEGESFLLAVSGKDQMKNIDSWSNTDVPGLWIYKASCEDNTAGFCCSCRPGWYGDGRNCLPDSQDERVNGRVNIELNGRTFIMQDLHCFVVTMDGRTYTAISGIPPELGWDMQGVVPVGTIISWLFAKPTDGGENGFSLTGGIFNYTAEVFYPDTGDRVSLGFEFQGSDVFNHLRAEVRITGTSPRVPRGGKLKVEDHSQQFSRAGHGLMSSRSEHSYLLEGTDKVVPYTVEQTVRWEECSGSEDLLARRRRRNTMKLLSSRNFIIYNPDDEAVRYAMTSTIRPLTGSEDPCHQVDCGEAGVCLVVGTEHTCSCLPGYTSQEVTGLCQDIDECAEGSHHCHPQALCHNHQGGFTCTCQDGYIGDGQDCLEERTCAELSCSEHAACVTDSSGQAECVCRRGYEGDGHTCSIIPSDLNIRGYANPETAELRPAADTDIATIEDIGPSVVHYYEISNTGPFDVGNVFLEVSWPLQSSEGDWLLYLTETPYVLYSAGRDRLEEEEEEDCLIDPQLVNNRNLGKARQTRQVDGEDYGTEYGTGVIIDPSGGMEEYDYSHLMEEILNQDTEEESLSVLDQTRSGDERAGGNIVGLAEAEKVVQESPEPPIYSGDVFGSVTFLCKLSLAVNENAVVHVPSRLQQSTIRAKYNTATAVSLQSEARLLGSPLVKAEDRVETVSSQFSVRPHHSTEQQAPGRGVTCGPLHCHKYATCSVSFGQQDHPACQCPLGFQGDGVEGCEPGPDPSLLSTLPPPALDCREVGCDLEAECQLEPESGYFSCVRRQTGYQESSYPSYSDFTTTSPASRGPGQYQCRRDEDCHHHASCQYDRSARKYSCRCQKWYEGDGWTSCSPAANAGCNIKQDCHVQAECLYSESNDQYFCRCRAGYLGDGYNCQEEPKIGCNVINNCGRFARCQFDPAARGYECRCDSVRGFEGDGYTCSPATSCLTNPAVCAPDADCVPGDGNTARCRCKPLFLGDGFECQPAPRFEGNFMLVAQGMMIFKVPFSGKGSKPINIQSSQVATGIDIDCMKGQVYWTDTTNNIIKRSDIDGKNVETFLEENMEFPEGIAVDWISRNVYWTDAGKDTIEVANLEDGARAVLLEEELESPRGIALHPGIGRMFWTDWDRYGPKIEAANMDGTDRMTLVDRDLGEPNSLAVDFFNYEVCWADAGSKLNGIKPKIDCIGVNGGRKNTVIELGEGQIPYGITITETNIMWTDWVRRMVHRVDKMTGTRQASIPYALSHLGKPYDLVNIPAECPNLSNTCQGEPCGGGRLCLPDGRGSHSCR